MLYMKIIYLHFIILYYYLIYIIIKFNINFFNEIIVINLSFKFINIVKNILNIFISSIIF